MPSRASSVASAPTSSRAQQLERVASSGMSRVRASASLPSLRTPGENAPRAAAPTSATAASSSSGATTRLTIPTRRASCASMRSPSSSSSLHALRADVAGQQRRDHEREQADVELRRAERRALACDHEVAGEREAERAGEHVAARRADHGLAELRDELEQAREQRRVGGREVREVAAAREDRRVRRGEHDAAHRPVVASRREAPRAARRAARRRARCACRARRARSSRPRRRPRSAGSRTARAQSIGARAPAAPGATLKPRNVSVSVRLVALGVGTRPGRPCRCRGSCRHAPVPPVTVTVPV